MIRGQIGSRKILLTISLFIIGVLISGCMDDELLKSYYLGVSFVHTLDPDEFTSEDVDHWINLSGSIGYEEEPLPLNNYIYFHKMIVSKETENGTFDVEIYQDTYDINEGRMDVYHFHGSIVTGKFDSRNKTRFVELKVLLTNEMDVFFSTMNWTMDWEEVGFQPLYDPYGSGWVW